MKKFKYLITILAIILLCVILDILSIYTRQKPIFAIPKQSMSVDRIYYGVFYDTHNCIVYSAPQIVMKWSEFSCPKAKENKIVDIIDLTKNKNINCAEALERIYIDDNYIYYLSCIKSQYIIVSYSNGYEENIKEALENNHIKIKDLDTYNIKYIKENKS